MRLRRSNLRVEELEQRLVLTLPSAAPPLRPDYSRPTWELSLASLREPEGAALGVAADRPPLARVDDRTAEGDDPLERFLEIGHEKVGQGRRIARPGAARMEADERVRVLARLEAMPR